MKKTKINFRNIASKSLDIYAQKFESAVKIFEITSEEDRLRSTTAMRSRFASFN